MPNTSDPVQARILRIRGARVILDADLARLYGVPTFRLNEAVKRNAAKFPDDFRFQLTREEFTRLKSPVGKSRRGPFDDVTEPGMSSQFAMSSSRRGTKYAPWAFTEHGALMAANVLRSPRAIEMAIYVVRAFVKQREALAANAAILKRLAEIDRTLLEHDSALQILWRRLEPLLTPPREPARRKIGFLPENQKRQSRPHRAQG